MKKYVSELSDEDAAPRTIDLTIIISRDIPRAFNERRLRY